MFNKYLVLCKELSINNDGEAEYETEVELNVEATSKDHAARIVSAGMAYEEDENVMFEIYDIQQAH